MTTLAYKITWDDDIDGSAKHSYAVELQKELKRQSPGLQPEIERDDEDAQDLGATLVAILSTGAALAIAKGIQMFFSKRGDLASVTVHSPDGATLEAVHINRKDALQLSEKALAAMFRSKHEDGAGSDSAPE